MFLTLLQQLPLATGHSGVASSSVFLAALLSSDIEDLELEDRRVRFFGSSASCGVMSWTKSFLVYNLAPLVGFSAAGELDWRLAATVAFLARDGDLALAGLLDLVRAGDFLDGDFLAALDAALVTSFDLERGFLVVMTGSDVDTSVTLVLSSLEANLDDLIDIFEFSLVRFFKLLMKYYYS